MAQNVNWIQKSTCSVPLRPYDKPLSLKRKTIGRKENIAKRENLLYLGVTMTGESISMGQPEIGRHYLKIRDGADVDPELKAYCKRTTFSSYTTADSVRTEKLDEYKISDTTVIEIAFRR